MGRFRCEERLSVDGPLENYRARVSGLGGFDRLFSLTCLAPGALARRPHAAEGLLRAARTAMTLKDPRIAAVSDSGLAPGSAFVASEFVHGVSLQELAEHLSSSTSPRALPPAVWGAVIAMIGAEIAGALGVAHAAATPVIHGALGPGNVMVTPQGAVKLLDFGLLSAVAAPIEITLMPGRAHLMAPELRPGGQPAGAQTSGTVTSERPADLFALGAMLERLTTIEAPEGPPGIGAFGPARPMPLSLRPLLRSMMAPAAAQRPVAADAEVSFRQIIRESRGIDVALELGTLVRLIMQLRPAQSEVAATPGTPAVATAMPETMGAPSGFGGPGQFGRLADQPFADEPTAILDVSADGKPSSLAAILLELRATDAEEEAASETPTDIPQATLSDLAMSNAMAREAAARKASTATPPLHSIGDGNVGMNLELPDSGATSMSAVPMSILSLSPSGEIASAAPPSPDEAVMDGDIEAGELPPSALSLEPDAGPNGGAGLGATPVEKGTANSDSGAVAADATMVSTEAPSLEELMPPHLHAQLPFFTDEGSEHREQRRPSIQGTPNRELFDLSSGEIAASLPDPRQFHPAGFPMPAPNSSARIGAPTARDQQVTGVPAAATPEPIMFAEFSAALPVNRPHVELKRETVTPPHWQPGNLDGPSRGASPAGKVNVASYSGPTRPRRIWAVAVAAVAVVSAIAIVLLSR